MTNKPMLSVERELLATALKADASIGATATELVKGWVAMVELRALLDEPDEPFNLQGWSIDHSAGRPILMHNKCSVIEAEQAYGLLNLIESAAQHQGEPVVWVECSPAWLKAGGDCATAPRICVGREGISHLHPAHSNAEQPAPVAVVMPELESAFEAWWESDGQYCRAGGGSYEKTFAYRGYEAALAEVARLNGVKP